MGDKQQIFTIHFPDKRVYIERTYRTIEEKINFIKDDKDHRLYSMFKDYPNPEILDLSVLKMKIVMKD